MGIISEEDARGFNSRIVVFLGMYHAGHLLCQALLQHTQMWSFGMLCYQGIYLFLSK